MTDCVTHHYCDCTAERIKQLERALERIASTNRDPRPDGTYNISRDALIDWAQRALHATEGQ